MSTFNFGISAESAVRNSRRQLAPWGIYDVKFIGCELAEGISKNDPSKSWKRLDIKFENEDGYFNVPLWFPKDSDGDRKEVDGKNGGKIVYPSNFEVLMATVKQAAQILNPAGFEKMQAASAKFKSFDDVAKALTQILEKVKGSETKLKLNGVNRNGKVEAAIPRIVGINKQGEAFISDNFIGSKLFFTDYEETQRAKYINSKPTDMSAEKADDPLADTTGIDKAPEKDEYDFDSLLA